jgi:lysyl-tRNA synthetase, class II
MSKTNIVSKNQPNNSNKSVPVNTSSVGYQIKNRTNKLRHIKGLGQNPYAIKTNRTGTLLEIKNSFIEGKKEVISARIKTIRMSGKIAFFVLEDESLPTGFQAIIKKDSLPEKSSSESFSFEDVKELLDEGDYVELKGLLGTSQRGEASLITDTVQILTKTLRPLPVLLDYENTEERYLNRVVDFKMNTTDDEGVSVRDIVRAKAKYWNIWREELLKEGFLEVYNPIFEHIPGGAEAKPFTTFYNELEQQMYMRISLELPLKKLIAGGFESVFEIGRVFRNESSSPQHLQEYTMVEWYKAYTDYHYAAAFAKRVYQRCVNKILGRMEQLDYYGNIINWGEWCSLEEATKNGWELEGGWPKIKYFDAVRYFSNGEIDTENKTDQELLEMCQSLEIEDVNINIGTATLLDKLWKKARVNTTDPFFLILPPVDLEPLAKRDDQDPRLVQRWQIVAGKAELGKAFSELNDPIDQFGRFEDQQKARDNGNQEAQFMDPDYVKAMELGMPPMSGFGTSERFVSFLFGKHIKECSNFPYIKKIEEEPKNRTMVAHMVINDQPEIPIWTKLNTASHLGASFASRAGDKLIGTDIITSKEELELVNNIKYAIVNYSSQDDQVLHNYYLEGQRRGLTMSLFTSDMAASSDDQEAEMAHSKKTFDQIKILGVLAFGKKSEVEELTNLYDIDKS